MPRLRRPIDHDLIFHAINRGNNRHAVFDDHTDYAAFLDALAQTQKRYPFRLFGYCLMANHFHLLMQPEEGQSISRILQSLTVAHTWRYHRRRRSVGHVWQGRFKSPVIQDDSHLLVVLRYIEANPLRAGMVADAGRYHWSSYAVHALGRSDPLVSELPGWSSLGASEALRQAYWRDYVHRREDAAELAAVRASLVSGRPFGSASWAQRTGQALGLALSRPRGRPRKTVEK